MKKLLFSATLVVFYVLLFNLQLTAQVCTADTQYTAPGIYPDSATGLVDDTVGIPYQQVITIIVPTDTTDPNCCTVTVDSMTLTGISNLPPGLSYTCNTPSCTWLGGTTGCILISGTVTNPVDTGTYNIKAYVTGYVTCGVILLSCSPFAITQADTVDYYTIDVLPAFVITTTTANASCAGVCNGSATANVTGGTGPYTYIWNDPSAQTNAIATGLCVGSYTVTVTNGYGITDSASVNVTAPVSVTASILSFTNVSCNGDSNGTATAAGSGGTPGYAYVWSTGDSIATVSGLSAGTYTVTVTDTIGCADSTAVTISQPLTLTSSASTANATCGNADGTATAIANGGTTPYSYAWSTSPSQTDSTATGLTSGSYQVTITDSNGCTDTAIASVSDAGAPTVTISNTTMASCNAFCDGSATVSATGGSLPYTYSWSTNPTQTDATATGLCAGTHTASVTDSLSCVAILSVTITQPPAIIITAESYTDISCKGFNNGTITVSATGGTGTLSYSIDSGFTFTNTSGNFTGLVPGVYNVAVQDSNGCTKNGNMLVVNEPAAVLTAVLTSTADNPGGAGDGSATANPSGGTSPYSYNWSTSPVQTSATASGLSSGDYGVTVTDANGCSFSDSVNVGVGVGLEELAKNLRINLYPNPAGNELFVELDRKVQAVLIILDVTGKQVKKIAINNLLTKVSIAELVEGIYLYQINSDENKVLYRGEFNIVK